MSDVEDIKLALDAIKRLDERELSPEESKTKEDIVMKMKKNTSYLKKKYGSRWKDVMYAIATKQAKKIS